MNVTTPEPSAAAEVAILALVDKQVIPRVEGQALKLGPKPAVTQETLTYARAHKTEILAFLATEPCDAAQSEDGLYAWLTEISTRLDAVERLLGFDHDNYWTIYHQFIDALEYYKQRCDTARKGMVGTLPLLEDHNPTNTEKGQGRS
jgi:hypothetical protein